jgi:hypothetical protein
MNDFLLDLWNDLREKRMLPVAGVLLLALIAVPVVLSKPSEQPASNAAAPPPKLERSEEARALVGLTPAADEPGDGSALDVFVASDPFKPPSDVIANSSESDSQVQSTGVSTEPATTGTPTSSDSSSGGGSTTTTTASPISSETKVVKYRYVVDVAFTANGERRTIEGMQMLDMLPNRASALLVFLGVSNSGYAVFLVDSTLIPGEDGQGKCKPSTEECSFLYLKEDARHGFRTDDGNHYMLRVNNIRAVEVGSDSGANDEESSYDASGAAVEGEPVSSHRFAPRLITELVNVPAGE